MLPHVLVVDDEPAIARCLATFLNGRGFHAETEGDAYAAIARLEERRWDVLVLDLRMGPGLRGDELLGAAAILDPDLPGRTVFMTGDHSPAALDLISRTGCRFYLRKPFSLTLLLDAVRALVDADRQIADDSRAESA